MNFGRTLAACLTAFLTAAPLHANETATPEKAQGVRTAPFDVDGLLHRTGLTGARIGFQVVDQENRNPITDNKADRLFMPASTAKFITAIGALGILGPTHRFRTSVLNTGALRNGTLTGDLYLKGSGDPLLSVQDLLGLADRLNESGLRRITGKFYYDESALPRLAEIDRGQPHAAPYNAGLSALTLDFNRIRAHWRAGENRTVSAQLSPAPGAGRITLSDNDPGPGRAFERTPGGGPEDWRVAPQQLAEPAGVTELPLRDPGRRTGLVFRTLAAGMGIQLPAPLPATAPGSAKELAGVDSLPLARLVRQALAHSNNVVSELIGLAAARKLIGKPDSLAASSAALQGWLTQRISDMNWQGLNLPNHSGLSAKARVTPAQMLTIVRHALSMRYGSQSILSLLPAGGWRDSFGGRFREPAVAGWVWGKTGTMHYATGMVGLFFGQTSGRRRVFTLYIMDDEKRKAYDADPARDGEAAQRTARDWIDKAKALEEELVSAWVKRY